MQDQVKQRSWAVGLSIAAVLMLSFPSARAVYLWLAPVRGEAAAISAAAGFELTYLALACLLFTTSELRRLAFRLQFWAVLTAVLLNSIESYSVRSGIDISTGRRALATFDAWLLGLSVAESIPLAGLAFGVSMVLHVLIARDAGSSVDRTVKRSGSWHDVFARFAIRPWQPWRLPSRRETIDPTSTMGDADAPLLTAEETEVLLEMIPSIYGYEQPKPDSEITAVGSIEELLAGREEIQARSVAASQGPGVTVEEILERYDRCADQAERRRLRAKLRGMGYRLSSQENLKT